MKNIIKLFSITILSPEFFVIFAALLLATYINVSDDWVKNNVLINAEAIKYIAFIPIGFGGWVLKNSRALLFPKESFNELLHSWEGYQELKLTVLVSNFYAFLFIVLGLSSWVFAREVNTFKMLVFIFTPTLGSIVLAITVYLAKIDQEEIMVKKL